MPRYRRAEKALLDRIESDELLERVPKLRRACRSVWAAGAPLVIHNFTPHDLEHSLRVCGYLGSMLAIGPKPRLCEEEAFLLLAGAYLHDIGMQCDLARRPDVLERAVAMGARLGAKLAASSPASYSPAEQEAVRRNHHLVSAAWVQHAAREGDEALGLRPGDIPRNLVQDLVDVCRFHSKLDLATCPRSGKVYRKVRLDLLAALLRYADELDVDANRVDVRTVRLFSVPPASAVYWYMHNHTVVQLHPRQAVLLTVSLCSKDAARYGELVDKHFVTAFRKKNRPVLALLQSRGVELSMNADSGVEASDDQEPLPAAIGKALRSLDPKHRLSADELAATLAEKTGLEKSAIKKLLAALTALVRRELGPTGPGEVTIPGLVTLKVVETGAGREVEARVSPRI